MSDKPRMWTLKESGHGHAWAKDWTGPTIRSTATSFGWHVEIEVVEKSAFDAALSARDEAERERDEFQQAAGRYASEATGRSEDYRRALCAALGVESDPVGPDNLSASLLTRVESLVRAEAQQAEARELLERWNAGVSLGASEISAETWTFLRRSGRQP